MQAVDTELHHGLTQMLDPKFEGMVEDVFCRSFTWDEVQADGSTKVGSLPTVDRMCGPLAEWSPDFFFGLRWRSSATVD